MYEIPCKKCGKTRILKRPYPEKGLCHPCSKPRLKLRLHGQGYVYSNTDPKRRFEHIYIMEQHLGRPLRRKEVVHHINENKTDNRIENLQLMTRGEHQRHHFRVQERLRGGQLECYKCKELKPFSEYRKRSSGILGFVGTCKICTKIMECS